MKSFKTYLCEDSVKSVTGTLFLVLRRKLSAGWSIEKNPAALAVKNVRTSASKDFNEAKSIISRFLKGQGTTVAWNTTSEGASHKFNGTIISIINIENKTIKISVS